MRMSSQLVREAVQAEKDAMGERLLQTFQGLKGLMHAQPFNERCNEASKDIMASLLGPQTAATPVSLPGVHAMSQAPAHTGASNGYAAFAGDQGHQVCAHARISCRFSNEIILQMRPGITQPAESRCKSADSAASAACYCNEEC